MVKASGLKPEGPGSIPDAAKNPLSRCSVHTCKICGSESPVIGRQQFTIGVGQFTIGCLHIKIEEMDGVAIYRRESEIGLLPL